VVTIDRYSFKDIPLDLLFNYYSSPKCSKNKTIKRHLLVIEIS
jgi:hypothetical protein